MKDRIEKRIELKAPVSRVWRALTDYREFGEWFRAEAFLGRWRLGSANEEHRNVCRAEAIAA
jgi:uncharacterized protein YndB with AHSA1/START domain